MSQHERKQRYVLWVTRSFLDYRIPVFQALDKLLGGRLKVIFSCDYVPEKVQAKVRNVLGARAIGLSGEWTLGTLQTTSWANQGVGMCYHPRLPRTIREHRPAVLIGDGFFKWTFASVIYKLIHGTPLVICYERTFHTERRSQWYRRAYRRMVIRLTDAMCCNGQLSLEYTRWLGMPVSRITTGHMVADTDFMRRKAESVAPCKREEMRRLWKSRNPVFLYVGRLIELKGISELLTAWSEFEKHFPKEGTLVIAGDGAFGDHLQEIVRSKGLRWVRFLGKVDYEMLPHVYAASDIFIMPTLEDNWSLVVPEAMACGLPVLCSKYNGCWPELVHSGNNGWIFDPLNQQDFLQKLRYCVDRQSLLKMMGEESKKIVADHSPVRAASSILAACELAMESTKCSAARQFHLQVQSMNKT